MEGNKTKLRWRRYRKVLKNIKDNYVLIATIPILIGGGAQLMGLLDLGIQYIRFFSSTQMLKDGLTILPIFLFISIWAVVIHIFYDLKKRKSYNYFLFGFIPHFIILNFYLGFSFKDEPYLYTYGAVSFTLTSIAVILMLIQDKFNFNFLKIIYGILLLSGISILLFFYSLFNSDLSSSKSVQYPNYQNVECYIEKQYYYNEIYEVKYFNDEFIFIRFTNEDKDEIRVIPFDVMLNDTYCD